MYATESAARTAAAEAEAGLRQARLADMTSSGSMVTLSRCDRPPNPAALPPRRSCIGGRRAGMLHSPSSSRGLPGWRMRSARHALMPPSTPAAPHSSCQTPPTPVPPCCCPTPRSLATFDEESGQDVQQRMNVIIKGDTSGVVEAIRGALSALPQVRCAATRAAGASLVRGRLASAARAWSWTPLLCAARAPTPASARITQHASPPSRAHPQDVVVLRYLLSAAGDVTTSDVDLAAASGGMVVAFNLEPDEAVLAHAKKLGTRRRPVQRRCCAVCVRLPSPAPGSPPAQARSPLSRPTPAPLRPPSLPRRDDQQLPHHLQPD